MIGPERSEEQRGVGEVLSGDSWEDEGVVESSQNRRDHLTTLCRWFLLLFVWGYTVPVIVRVLNPGLELHSPVVSLMVKVAAGTVTFPAPVAKVPVVLS